LLQAENEDDALLMAMALSRSEQDHPEAVSVPVLSHRSTQQLSNTSQPKHKIIENLFQKNDEEISPTPRFAASALTKKYNTSKPSLVQQQEASRWKAPEKVGVNYLSYLTCCKVSSPKKPPSAPEAPKDTPKVHV
jgi:hypothetical protein